MTHVNETRGGNCRSAPTCSDAMTRQSGPDFRPRHAGWAVIVSASIAVLAGACSGGHQSASASASNSSTHSDVAYAECMRSHGVKDFPDPNPNGGFTLNGGRGSDLDQSNPTYQRANQACKSLRPQQSAQQRAQITAAMLKFARCMRSHGIRDFPDPSDGEMKVQQKPGGDLDENNPQFKTARRACSHDLPAAKRGK